MSRALALLGAFDERPPPARPVRPGPAGRAAAAHGAPAGRRAGRTGARWSGDRGRRVRGRPAAVGPRTARPGADRPAPGGLAVPARHLRAPPWPPCTSPSGTGRGALRRPPGRQRLGARRQPRSGRGCRCTPPASARCCSPTRPAEVQERRWRSLTRVTPYTITQPGRLRAQLAPRPPRRLRADRRGDEPGRLLGGGADRGRRRQVVAALGIVVPSLRRDRTRPGRRPAGRRAAASPGAWSTAE